MTLAEKWVRVGMGGVIVLLAIVAVMRWREDHRSPKPPSWEMFYEAARRGNVASVQRHLETGIDPNATADFGVTALHFAAFYGQADVIQSLCDYGASVNSQNSKGDTALHWAASQGHLDAVEQLINYGADPRILGERNHTAREIALAHSQVAVADYLETVPVPTPTPHYNERKPVITVRFSADSRAVSIMASKMDSVTLFVNHGEQDSLTFSQISGTRGTFSALGRRKITAVSVTTDGITSQHRNPLYF